MRLKLCLLLLAGHFSASALGQDEVKSGKTVLLQLQYVSSGLYATYFTAGSPPQKVPVAFDSGSSDSVLPQRYFHLNASSSGQFLNNDFSIIYGSGAVNGAWVKDTLHVNGDTVLNDFQFAVGQTYRPQELGYFASIGIGLKNFETTNTFEYGINHKFPNTLETKGPKYTYDNFPSSLKKAGYIDKNVYAVGYPQQASEGSIIFGGVDTSKYDSLVTVPIVQKSTGDWAEYTEASLMVIAIDLMTIEYGNKSEPFTLKRYPALVDTLTYAFSAPMPVIESLESLLGGEYDPDAGILRYECQSDLKLAIWFGDSKIEIPVNQIASFDDGCYLDIVQSPDDFMIFGLSILNNLYTVFDADDLEISLGIWKDSETLQIVSLSHDAKVPGAKRVSNYSPVFDYVSQTDRLVYDTPIYA